MGEDVSLIEQLKKRIQELEDKLEALRISRRVLMNLIDSLEHEKREQLTTLESRNVRLQKNNYRYARIIMYRNLRIVELEQQLKNFSN